MSVSAVVTESAQPTGEAALVDVTVSVSSNSANFTYSRDVNASSAPEIFPFLPSVTNQSLTYQASGVYVNVKLANVGTAPVDFNGTTYQATKYLVSFSAENSSSYLSGTWTGNVTCMPSGLVNTVQLSLGQTATVNATLISTNLSLKAAAIGINPVGASLLGVALAAAIAIAAPIIYRKEKDKKHAEQNEEEEKKPSKEGGSDQGNAEEKPSYWVD